MTWVTSPLVWLVGPGRSRLFLVACRSEASPRRAGHTSLYYCAQTIRTEESPRYVNIIHPNCPYASGRPPGYS
jgi:hypothetical protein